MLPAQEGQSAKPAFLQAPGDRLYSTLKPWAHGVKVLLQMLVGLGAVVDIGIHVAHSVATHAGNTRLAPNITISIAVIAYALAVAAAIELAYTLFTPGPDEALDPLMLGVSSAILILVSGGFPHWAQVAALITGVVAPAILFLVRRYLLEQEGD